MLGLLYGLGIPMLVGVLGWPAAVQALIDLANGLADGFGANRLHRWLLPCCSCTVTAEEPLAHPEP